MKKYLSKKNPQGVSGYPSLTMPSPENTDSHSGTISSEPTTPASLGGLIAPPHPTLMRSNTISGLPQTNVAHVLQSLYPGTFPHIAANLFRLSAATSGVPAPSGQSLATVASVHAAAAALSKQQTQPQRLLSSPPASVSSSTSSLGQVPARKLSQPTPPKPMTPGSSAPRPDMTASSVIRQDDSASDSNTGQAGCSSSTSTIRRSKGQPYIPSYMDLSNGPEPCVVCGDAATGYHYRCMTCEGCKGFFRRTIQKTLQYHCKWSGNCIIDKNTRNQCQKCRFEKCIAVGMATDLVLNERQRLAKRKLIEENRARRRQEQVRMRGRGDSSMIEESLTDEDVNIIETIRTAYEEAELRRARNLFGVGQSERDALSQLRETPEANRLTNIMTPAIIKVVDFAKAIPDFVKLPLDDQIVLLKASCLEIMCLRTASRFCRESGTLPLRNGTVISRDDLETLITQDSSATLYEPIFDFAYNLSKLDLDPSEVALLAATLVTQTDRSGLKDDSAVEDIQDQILGTFKRYVAAHRPENPLHWAKIIMKVTDLRSICQVHAERVLLNSLETSSKLMPSFLALFGEYEDFELSRDNSGEASEMEELLPGCPLSSGNRSASSHKSDHEDGAGDDADESMEYEDGHSMIRQTSTDATSVGNVGEEEEDEDNMVGIEDEDEEVDRPLTIKLPTNLEEEEKPADEEDDELERPLTIKLPTNFEESRERNPGERLSEET